MKELKNARIKKIAEQAGLPTADYYVQAVIGPQDIQKFAELIIKECSSVAQKYMSRWPEDHKLTKRIKEHFGVTE
jgi:phosphotransferase system IIB component